MSKKSSPGRLRYKAARQARRLQDPAVQERAAKYRTK